MASQELQGPQRKTGGVYCSPWCGGGCTWADFQAKTRQAASLAAVMGEGWKPHVWENGGWHCYAVKGDSDYHAGLAEIHPSASASEPGGFLYAAWINPKTDGVGQTITKPTFSDPVEAMQAALKIARRRANAYSVELDGIA